MAAGRSPCRLCCDVISSSVVVHVCNSVEKLHVVVM